jgi:hypothetical protein
MPVVLAWEIVAEKDPGGTRPGTLQRASVPGGWLLRDTAARGSLLFIADPAHAWGAPDTHGREIDFGELE